jgi:hypothetical protein
VKVKGTSQSSSRDKYKIPSYYLIVWDKNCRRRVSPSPFTLRATTRGSATLIRWNGGKLWQSLRLPRVLCASGPSKAQQPGSESSRPSERRFIGSSPSCAGVRPSPETTVSRPRMARARRPPAGRGARCQPPSGRRSASGCGGIGPPGGRTPAAARTATNPRPRQSPPPGDGPQRRRPARLPGRGNAGFDEPQLTGRRRGSCDPSAR